MLHDNSSAKSWAILEFDLQDMSATSEKQVLFKILNSVHHYVKSNRDVFLSIVHLLIESLTFKFIRKNHSALSKNYLHFYFHIFYTTLDWHITSNSIFNFSYNSLHVIFCNLIHIVFSVVSSFVFCCHGFSLSLFLPIRFFLFY